MLKRKCFIGLLLMFSFSLCACGVETEEKVQTEIVETAPEEKKEPKEEFSAAAEAEQEKPQWAVDADGKYLVDWFSFYWDYTGYLDEVQDIEKIVKWKTEEVLADYNQDGIEDRIYVERSYTEGEGVKSQYSIDFRDGTMLHTEPFGGAYMIPFFRSIDFDGDGINEIIFSGAATFCNYPMSGGLLETFRKNGKEYEKIPLSEFSYYDEKRVGYSLLVKDIQGNVVTMQLNGYPLTVSFPVKDSDLGNNTTLMGLYRDDWKSGRISKNAVWAYRVEEYKGKPSLVLYEAWAQKHTSQNILIRLMYQDGEWVPVELLEEKQPLGCADEIMREWS